MLTDFETLRQRGLIERIDFLALMRGEEVAISFANEDNSLSPLPFALSDVDDDRHEECSTADERSIEAACITYMELQYSYQSVASQLQFRFGVSAGDKVLICCKGRHAAEIVALLSCIKLRATFVPIDESWIGTGSRLKDIVEDAQPTAAIVACESDMDPAVLAFASAGLFRCVYLNSNGDLVQTFNILTDSNVETYGTVAAEDSNTSNSASEYERLPLYVMYTSGSSGRPKGVLGTYRGLIYRILWQLEHFPFANGEVVCRRTPLVFVDSMAEIFSALVSMTPLWCPPKERLKAGGIGGIAGEAEAAGVSRITLLPSQLHQACTLYADIGALWPSLSTVFVSGEECTFGVVDAVKQRLPNVTLVNLYGSTEVAGDVTYMTLCGPGSPAANNLRREVPNKVPIGVPIKGNYLYIVSLIAASDASSDYISSTSTAAAPSDQNIRCMILPEGEVGELLVTGEHLARGYHSIPQSTNSSSSAKFIPNPLRALLPESDPACAYDSAFLTGDLAYCRCGVYYWCGRKDRQVKIRGVRLELEEVERAVATALQVDQQSVVVLASQPALPRPSDANNAKFLALFVERSCLSKAKGMRSNSNDVKEVLSAALIPAMHPAHVVILDAFPRNTSGKIDRPALQQRLDSMFFSAAVHENASRAATLPTSTLPSTPINLTELSVQEVGLKIAEVYHKVLSLPFSAKETQPEDVIKMEFFGMGGDSVRMIEVLWELRKWTTRPVLPADLLQPIEALARQLKGETSDASEGPTHKRARTESIPPHDHDTEDDANAAAAFNSQPPLFYPKASPLRLISESTRSFVYSLGRSGTSWLHRDAPPDLLSIGKSAAGKEGTTSALAVKWSVKLAKCVDASPLVIFSTDAPPTPDSAIAPHSYQQPYQHQQPNQQVIIGSHDGDVISVDGATGDVLWTLQLGEHIEASAVPNPAGDVFFLGSYSGQDVDGFRSHRPVQQQQKRMSTEEGGEEVAPALGCLWAIRSATGEVLWHFCTAGEMKASVLVLDQCLFLGAYDGYLYQLNAADGTLIAKLHCGGSIYASPVASKDGTNFVVCTTSGVISQFSFPGGLAAITPLQSLQSVPVFSTPLAVGAAFITAGTDGSLTCREFSGAEITAVVEEEEEEEKENVLWSAVPSHTAIFSSACIIPVPASAGSTAQEAAAIIGCHDGKLRKFSVRDGAVMWECNVGVAIFASPCMASATECVFATAAGDVLVVEVETGVIRAKLRLPAEVFSSPVCVDNCIYIGCRDDRLYCLERINL